MIASLVWIQKQASMVIHSTSLFGYGRGAVQIIETTTKHCRTGDTSRMEVFKSGNRSGSSENILRLSVASFCSPLRTDRVSVAFNSSPRSARVVRSAEDVVVCTNEQAQIVLLSAACMICATPESPDRCLGSGTGLPSYASLVSSARYLTSKRKPCCSIRQ